LYFKFKIVGKLWKAFDFISK